MALHMLATDIAVCLIRGTSRILDARIASVAPDELCISAVTRGELLLGLSREAVAVMAEEAPTSERRRHRALPAGRAVRSPKAAAKPPAAIPTSDPAATAALRRTTHSVLAALSPREAKLLRMRFGIELSSEPTLESVSRQFARTRERIKSGNPSEDDPENRGVSTVIAQFLARVSCLSWDAAAASCFATVAIDSHQSETPLSTAETMVAGHALAVDAVLVTAAEARYSEVRGLKTEDWTRRPAPQ